MEWKNVRKWLLLMLLVVDVFLAGNLIRQVEDNRRAERQALLDAVTVAQRRGVTLDSNALLDLPIAPESWRTVRSEGLEQGAADALLGQGSLPEGPGGGVSIYRGEAGQLSFRRGGALELDLLWSGEPLTPEVCHALLTPAGLAGEDAVTARLEDGVELRQEYQDTPIVNSRLTCRVQEGKLQVRGRWLLGTEMTAGQGGLSRAQLVLSLCALLEGQETSGPVTVTAGYWLQSEDARRLTLVPVWAADTGETTRIVSCLTGEELLS